MTTLSVGPGQPYSTVHDALSASRDGDTVRVQAGTYTNDFATIRHSVAIVAVGGTVHLLATESPLNGKGILTLGADGTNISITGFEFSGAAVRDGNGAGIRYEGGTLTLVDDYFHDNENGVLATPVSAGTGTITVRNSEFARNGSGDGYSHNLYVGDVARLDIDGSYFHDASVGHEIKSRAEVTTVTNSRIVDGQGTASYSVDLPNGGEATISGNVIEQGAGSQNPIIIAYGEEGGIHPGFLTVTGNTVVNHLGSSSSLAVWNATGVTAEINGNTVFGLNAAQIVRGPGNVAGLSFLVSEQSLQLPGRVTAAPATVPAAASAETPITAPSELPVSIPAVPVDVPAAAPMTVPEQAIPVATPPASPPAIPSDPGPTVQVLPPGFDLAEASRALIAWFSAGFEVNRPAFPAQAFATLGGTPAQALTLQQSFAGLQYGTGTAGSGEVFQTA